jgi:aminoglycoside phosphotransferase (APT) family kinase protein
MNTLFSTAINHMTMAPWSSLRSPQDVALLFAGTAAILAYFAYRNTVTLSSAPAITSDEDEPESTEKSQNKLTEDPSNHEKSNTATPSTSETPHFLAEPHPLAEQDRYHDDLPADEDLPKSSDDSGSVARNDTVTTSASDVPGQAVKEEAVAEEKEQEHDNDKDQDEDDDDDDESEYDEFELFRPVMSAIDLEKVKNTAIAVRAQHQRQETASGKQSLTCTVNPDPCCGSYNLIYYLQWSDGQKWVLRIPGHGLDFDHNDATRMSSEYQTMNFIRQQTSIPIPEVYCWETDSTRIGVPFAFMAFVEGQPLSSIWYDKNRITESTRLEILSNVAAHMSQLHRLPFSEMGMLQFGESEAHPTVGPIISRKVAIHVEGWGVNLIEGPYKSMTERLMNILDELVFYTDRGYAYYPLLSMAIESIPKSLDGNGYFYISPWDLDLQNIMVDDNGHITALIDWDNVCTKPAAFGFARYPEWIIHDWDPVDYYYANLDVYEEQQDPKESTPEALARYRQHYASCFARSYLDNYDPRMTKASHILRSIGIALENDMSQPDIVGKLLDHAFGGVCPFRIRDYMDDFVADNTDEKDELIKAAFHKMWQVEMKEAWSEQPGLQWLSGGRLRAGVQVMLRAT